MKRRFTNATESAPAPGTRAVSRALAILRTLGESHSELGLGELSVALGLHKTTVFRLVGALAEDGFVVHDESRQRYRLGPTLLWLGAEARRTTGLHAAARPSLVALAAAVDETATLEVLVGDEVLIVDEAQGPYLLGASTEVGMRWPAHATSTGKVLLAAATTPYEPLPPGLPDRLAEVGPRSISCKRELARQLVLVRAAGAAVTIEELEVGFAAVAAPVHDARGRVIAAIGIGGPTSRLTEDRLGDVT
ncbi:MAG: IclR family transcriptional regulator, partial [Gemmatimonadaceae bacterium]